MHSKTLKWRLLGIAAGTALFLGTATVSHAGTQTANLAVNATVTANCTVSTAAVAFGSYDPVVANATTALNGTGSVTVTCTSGDAANVTLGQGTDAATGSTAAAPLRQMKDSGSDVLAYSLYSDSARSTVWGNTTATGVNDTGNGAAQTLTVYGAVAAGQNVPAGTYSDTVVATVTF